MNLKSTLCILIACISSILQASDPPVFIYEGEIAGVVCSACSSHVKAALSKLDGVTAVKITLGKEGSIPHLEVISTSSSLTKDAAIKALGPQAHMYVIQSFKRAGK